MNACLGRKGLTVALFAFACARSASARAPLPISVEREPGAEDCPDTAGLVARVQAILGRDASDAATPYRVTFAHTAQTFTASIQLSSDASTVRSLAARDPTCTGIAHATAIALAVLFDSDLKASGAASAATQPSEAVQPSETANPSEAPSPPTTARPTQPPPRKALPPNAEPANDAALPPGSSARARVDPLFAIGAAALAGVLRPLGFGLVADLGLESKNLRGTLGALWVPTETLTLPPGTARESLFSGTLRGCYALLHAGRARLDGCTGALFGVARAQARGFTVDQPQHRELFLAFPAELALSMRSRSIGWELGASALLLCPPDEFKVEGLGVTYHPAPVAGLFTLRVFVEPPH